ncbi:MAG TPA: hypothetical protein VMB05_14565 [Solirubrobacteraceae bacterium]|nr:hypothetical protein [Solirubrobacteraceae bacterium]
MITIVIDQLFTAPPALEPLLDAPRTFTYEPLKKLRTRAENDAETERCFEASVSTLCGELGVERASVFASGEGEAELVDWPG